MSHDGTWRELCLSFDHSFGEAISTARDKYRRWLWRLVRHLGNGETHVMASRRDAISFAKLFRSSWHRNRTSSYSSSGLRASLPVRPLSSTPCNLSCKAPYSSRELVDK